jgi:uncharacterized protein YfaS (alpha-2-macroglobulin family)
MYNDDPRFPEPPLRLRGHDHVLDHVDDYIHCVLSPSNARYVESHADTCRICKVALEEARKRQAAFETVPAVEAPASLVQSTLTYVEAQIRRRRRLRRILLPSILAPAAAVFLVLIGLHIHYATLKPSPFDLRVLGQTNLLSGTNASLRVSLIDRLTGAALANVPVVIELHSRANGRVVTLADFRTDTQGTGQPHFQLPDWEDGSYDLRVTARPGGDTEVVTQTVRLLRSWKLMLSSDKPVYQPGQEIHLRSLALRRPDLKPVAGQEVIFTITDPKNNIIFKQRNVSSTFGISSCDCPLDSEILEGAYSIACKIGDTESKLAVEVKKYVLPKFKVDVTLEQPFYQPGQKVHGTVQADYFFGKPVAEGTIDVEVKTTEVQPKVVEKLSTRTDAAGKAMFDFRVSEKLIGKPQDSGDARLTIEVTVTDTAGQKQSKAVSRIVTTQPLRVEVIPEAGTLVQGLPNQIYLFASYADGRPAKARLAVSGLDKELTTNELGVASFETTPTSFAVTWTIQARDNDGHTGRKEAILQGGTVSRDFLVRTDRAVYNGGDTVHLTALGGGVEPVFVDFIKDGQTLLTQTIEVTSGHGEEEFDLPAELFGTVQLCAYRFGEDGLPVAKTRALYIRQAGDLDIKAALDQQEYRPGKQARLRLTLSDRQGHPTPGAISLAAVDEAVFSVLDQAPGMERLFYTLEQQLLQPVYAIYPWSPDPAAEVPAEERNLFDQALFSRTVEVKTDQRSRSTSVHSLVGDSFTTNLTRVQADSYSGLHRVWIGWMTFVGCLLALGYAGLWIFLPARLVGGLHLAILVPVVIAFGCAGCFLTFLSPGGDMKKATGVARSRGEAESTFGPMNDGAAPREDVLAMQGGRLISGDPASNQSQNPQSSIMAPRVREWFPETLLWRPELITDDQGVCALTVDLADSITTWRLTGSAVTADGRLGALQAPLRVFQPFFVDLNLPVALTRNDEVAVPVVVYNYLEQPQTVTLTLAQGNWFALQGEAVQKLDLQPNEVRSTSFRLKVQQVGNHKLEVTARGARDIADAVRRDIEVVPDGRRVEQVFNGSLQQPADLSLTIPPDAIDGSAKAILKIYPSKFSQLVEGLDGIFRMPYGCFEQTSSTTYPNVLALDYLRRTRRSAPEVEAKARQYIHLGYQRLLGFEVQGGGFDWFGRSPANRTLTAYGLMEFQDMARVHDVDPQLIARTRQWLLKQRNADGSWEPEGNGLHDDVTRRGELAKLSTTAYIAWAVFSDPAARDDADKTLRYLRNVQPAQIDDPHVLALVANALLVLDSKGSEARAFLDRLEAVKTVVDDKHACWYQPANRYTTFCGAGRAGSVETTALATLALLKAKVYPGTVRAALTWLVEQKDANGTWFSTQATVLALKALLAGSDTPLADEQARHLEIALNGQVKHTLDIPADQAEVMRQVDLSPELIAGVNRLTITETSGTAAEFQVAFRYHVSGDGKLEEREPLDIRLEYDRTDLAVGETVKVTATVVNQMDQAAPMVILDLPIPAGFAPISDDWTNLVAKGTIAKFSMNPRTIVVYLRGLERGQPLKLEYTLRATMPVKIAVPAARAYEYYDTDKQGRSQPTRLTVVPRK